MSAAHLIRALYQKTLKTEVEKDVEYKSHRTTLGSLARDLPNL